MSKEALREHILREHYNPADLNWKSYNKNAHYEYVNKLLEQSYYYNCSQAISTHAFLHDVRNTAWNKGPAGKASHGHEGLSK